MLGKETVSSSSMFCVPDVTSLYHQPNRHWSSTFRGESFVLNRALKPLELWGFKRPKSWRHRWAFPELQGSHTQSYLKCPLFQSISTHRTNKCPPRTQWNHQPLPRSFCLSQLRAPQGSFSLGSDGEQLPVWLQDMYKVWKSWVQLIQCGQFLWEIREDPKICLDIPMWVGLIWSKANGIVGLCLNMVSILIANSRDSHCSCKTKYTPSVFRWHPDFKPQSSSLEMIEISWAIATFAKREAGPATDTQLPTIVRWLGSIHDLRLTMSLGWGWHRNM